MQDLSLQQLTEIRDALAERIQDGLTREGQQVACLPAYLSPPPRGLSGQALVVDAGGTNLRTAWVEIGQATGYRALAGPLTATLPDGRQAPVSGTEFFDFQAEQLRALGAPVDLPLGYCFSYPTAVERDGDARLLYWTKGIRVSGVEGTLVGQALRQSLGGRGGVKVLNDTVAALLGGALGAAGDYQHFIGLIVGTGTNAATFFPGSKITKLSQPWEGSMAVNLESGNFHPPHLSEVDERLDQASDNPGCQRYEKAISGYYLPRLFALLCPDLPVGEEESSQLLVEWADRPDDGPPSLAARWLLARSADLVAGGLAAVAAHLEPGSLAIQAEGGLFWNATGYSDRVQSTLSRLVPSNRRFQIVRVEDVNLLGAAAAALSG